MRLLLCLLLLVACDNASQHLPIKNLTIIKQNGQEVRLGVEVADDDIERANGLMHRTLLPEDRGMLFVFDTPGIQKFWMKETLIPLDMIFIDAEGKIAHIHTRARPEDTTPVSSRFPVNRVLEINAGLANRWGLQAGDVIKVADSKPLN
ncbi:MAG: DUF192 domain-containing protein [Bdellovibrionales bacterium]